MMKTFKNSGTMFIMYSFIILFAGIMLVSFALNQKTDTGILIATLFYFLAVMLVNLSLHYLKKSTDQYLLPLAVFIANIGLIELYRLNKLFYYRQITWIIAGILIYFIITYALKDHLTLSNYSYLFLIIGITLQIMVSIWGTEINYAKLWFNLGFFYFQPSEVIKILLVIFLAYYLSKYKEFLSVKYSLARISTFKYLVPVFIMWILCMFILVLQKDLGMALLLFSIFLTMFYVSTSRKDLLFLSIGLFSAGTYFCYKTFSHIRVRFISWINPWSDIYGMGHQIIQGLFSVVSGGLFGTGLGLGKPYYIPAVETDFIFDALAEELGFLGVTALILLYIILIGKALKIAVKAKDTFGKLLACGLISIIAWQAIVIISGNLKIIPLTGITLPFVSYGGSSIVSNFIILAILTVIDRRQQTEDQRPKV